MSRRLQLAVFISGTGSNLQAIARHIQSGQLQADIVTVISNRRHAAGLDWAESQGLRTQLIEAMPDENRTSYDQRLIDYLAQFKLDLIVLAGFMRILSPVMVDAYLGRLINIHPSLLPAYKGLHTHQRVLDNGCTEHGTSIHFVNHALDGGAIISQSKLTVHEEDTAVSLAKRVQQLEHQLYPLTLQWFAENRVQLLQDHVHVDGRKLPDQGLCVEF